MSLTDPRRRLRTRAPTVLDLNSRRDDDVLQNNKAINARSARSHFAQIVKASQVQGDRVVITEHGSPAVAVIPLSDLRILSILDQMELKNRVSDASFRSVSLDELKDIILGGAKKVRKRDRNRGQNDDEPSIAKSNSRPRKRSEKY